MPTVLSHSHAILTWMRAHLELPNLGSSDIDDDATTTATTTIAFSLAI